MTDAKKTNRKITFFVSAIVLLVTAFSAGWFFVAGKVDDEIAKIITQTNGDGKSLSCENRDVVGFPFRMGLNCKTIAFRDDLQGVSLSGGQLRTAAQVYAPNHHIAELHAPVRLETPQMLPVELNWKSMLSSVKLLNNEPNRITIEGKDVSAARALEAEANLPLGAAKRTFVATELLPRFEGEAPKDIRAYFELNDLRIANIAIPPIQVKSDVFIKEGVALLSQDASLTQSAILSDGMVELKFLIVQMGESSLDLAGSFLVDDNGFLNGELKGATRNLEDGLAKLEDGLRGPRAPANSNLKTIMETILTFTKQDDQDPAVRTLPPITVEKGALKMGFIPLGMIPPFKQ